MKTNHDFMDMTCIENDNMWYAMQNKGRLDEYLQNAPLNKCRNRPVLSSGPQKPSEFCILRDRVPENFGKFSLFPGYFVSKLRVISDNKKAVTHIFTEKTVSQTKPKEKLHRLSARAETA